MHAKKASRDKLPTCNDAHKWCTTVCKQDDFGLRLQFLPVELRRNKSSVRWSNEKSQAGYSIPHLVDQILFFFGSYPNFGSNHGLIRLNVHLLQKECELLPEWVSSWFFWYHREAIQCGIPTIETHPQKGLFLGISSRTRTVCRRIVNGELGLGWRHARHPMFAAGVLKCHVTFMSRFQDGEIAATTICHGVMEHFCF